MNEWQLRFLGKAMLWTGVIFCAVVGLSILAVDRSADAQRSAGGLLALSLCVIPAWLLVARRLRQKAAQRVYREAQRDRKGWPVQMAADDLATHELNELERLYRLPAAKQSDLKEWT